MLFEITRKHPSIDERRLIIRRCSELGKTITPYQIDYIFWKQFSLVENKKLLKDLKTFLYNHVPDYFWYVPASLAKYHFHPRFNREKGCVKHTKEVIKNAIYFCYMYDYKNVDESICAATLHDTDKFYFDTKGSDRSKDHGDIVCEKIWKNNLFPDNPDIAWAIARHMGRFGTPKKDPHTVLDRIIQISDFIASKNLS